MKDLSHSVILENIRSLRERKKYSQEYMGMKLSISQNAYSKLETGKTKLTIDRLVRIAAILETNISRLILPPPR